MEKRTIIIILILTLSIYVSNINVQSAVEENNYRSISLELTPHDPISITSDNGFEVFPGLGTEIDPYIIENYEIISSSENGIYIIDTTKHFTVRNCYVDAGDYGIYIRNVADGTATVINNTCNNNGYGIFLYDSDVSTIANNTCSNNNLGIFFYDSDVSTVTSNTCSNNHDVGIELFSSSYCVVTYNLLQENGGYGVYLFSGSNDNLIHHNTFVDNSLGGTSQAYDSANKNIWYDPETKEGNYWSDWLGTDSYSIDGYTGTEDLYPLDEPAEYSVESTTDENQLSFTLTLLMLVIPLMLTKIISKKVKK